MRFVELLNRAASGWTSWAVAGLIEATILLGVVSLVLLLAGKRLPAAAAHVALLLVLVKVLVPIRIPVPRPELTGWFTRAGEHAQADGEHEAGPVATATTKSEPDERASDAEADALTAAEPIVTGPPVSPSTVVAEPTATFSPTDDELIWQAFAMLGWVAISAALVARLVYLQWRLRRAMKAALATAEDSLESLVGELAGRLGILRVIDVVVGPGDISPAIAGCWRPTLIVPRGLESRLSHEQLEWVLLHELAHVRRGDPYILAFERVVECLAWFNPAVWQASRWAEHYRECACDELALEHTPCSRGECGEAFWALLAASSPTPSLSIGFLSRGRLTKRRMQRLVDDVSARHIFGKRLSAALLAGVSVLAALSLSERRVAAENPAIEATNEPEPNRVERDVPPASLNTPPRLAEAEPLVDRIQQQQNAEIHSARMRVKVLYLSKSKDSPIQQGHELAERANHHLESLLDRTDFSRPDCLRKLRDALVEGNLILDHPSYRTIDLAWRRTNGDTRFRIVLDEQATLTYDNHVVVEYLPRERVAFVQRFPRIMQDSGLGRFQHGLWDAGPIAFASVLRQHKHNLKVHPTAFKRGRDGTMQLVLSLDSSSNRPIHSLQLTGDKRIVRLDTSYYSQPIRELDFQQYPGGVVFPRVRISQYYPDPMTLEDITVTIIEHAEFNVDIPDSEFHMAVPANTAVWDRRGELKLRAAETATDDVLTLFER